MSDRICGQRGLGSPTLQEAFQIPPADGFLNRIRDEAAAAKKVKEDVPVMVILGNPPYAYDSVNTDPWIVGLVRDYYQVDGEPLGERNPKGLLDDYVKFIRFAEHRIDLTGYGVLAFITNHGYLDNPTFRGMRQHLIQTFDEIYLLDLHGNSKKKEVCPDRSPDQNVFDIQQGVAIGIFIKCPKTTPQLATVYHAELWGMREIYQQIKKGKELIGGKYHWLAENDIKSTEWTKIEPQNPNYLFKPQDTKLLPEYQCYWGVNKIFEVNSSGMNTLRDKLVISFTKPELISTVKDLVNLDILDRQFKQKYQLPKDSRDWNLSECRKKLYYQAPETITNSIIKCLYRPFDLRWIILHDDLVGYPRWATTHHFMQFGSLGLATTKQTRQTISFFVSNIPFGQHKIVDPYDRSYIFPLYLYPTNQPTLFDLETSNAPGGRRTNLAEEFTQDFASRLGLAFIPDGKGDKIKTFGPEDIFNYIYAVFHSPTYRERYAEFLKIDFPRVPLTFQIGLVQGLCENGDRLVNLHLMKAAGSLRVTYPEPGDNQVEKVRYTEPKNNQPGRVYLNKNQYFEGVHPEVWHFYVGGYQVCQKWLKDRQGRTLDYDDLTHYQNIVAALAETIILMQEIDALITKHGGFPIY